MTSCPQCGGKSRPAFSATDLNQRVTTERFTYYRCSRCRLVFLRPIPDNLGRYYPRDYHGIPKTLDDVLKARPHEQFKLDVIGPEGQGRRLLEIGPSYGRFSAIAKQAGFAVHAIEMDPDCCRFLREVVGISVTETSDILASLRSDGAFDVVALWHSLEHLPDPWAVLDALATRVKPDGLLAIATPNPESVQFRVFGRHWIHLDAPRHVSLIPNSVMAGRLARHGFKQTHFSSRDQGAADCNALGWLISPTFKFPHWMMRRPFTSLGWRIRERLKKIEARDPYGAAYTAVFRKVR